jgi:hypothetical protein
MYLFAWGEPMAIERSGPRVRISSVSQVSCWTPSATHALPVASRPSPAHGCYRAEGIFRKRAVRFPHAEGKQSEVMQV